MKVNLLETIKLTEETEIIFENEYRLSLLAGVYYTCAFGVVIDCNAHKCIACGKAKWKIK